MMVEIYEQWCQWDLYDADDIADIPSPLAYYVVPTYKRLCMPPPRLDQQILLPVRACPCPHN